MVSAALMSSAALWEGTKYTPYKDVGGVWTVCMGSTGPSVVQGKRYTPTECSKLLEAQLKSHGADMLKCVNVPLSQNEYDAYTLFTYNVGANNFCKANFVKLLNQGQHTAACNGMATNLKGEPVWSYGGGKYIQGLQNRRQYEKKICLGELNAR